MSPVAMPAGGGWISVAWREPERRLSLRVEERKDGRLQIVELVLADPEGLSGALLRDLPLGAWEAQMNSPEIAAALRARIGEGELYSLDELAYAHENLARELNAEDMGADDGGLEFRFEAGASYAVSVSVEPQLKLNVAPGKRTDAFYHSVAVAYSGLAGRSRRPAQELAAINDVPASTVHRWVKEARRRGLLGPGRRLAAGSTLAHADVAGQGAQIIYDPTSPAALEWARRAREGQISEADIAGDPVLLAWTTRIRRGAMGVLEMALDPIVNAYMQRLDDKAVPDSKYRDPIVRLVLHPGEPESRHQPSSDGELDSDPDEDEAH